VTTSNSRKTLNVYYHDDVYEDPTSTSMFVKRLSYELAKFLNVTLFVYSDVQHVRRETTLGVPLYRVPRPRIPIFRLIRVNPFLTRVYNSLVAFSPKLYLFSKKIVDANYILCVDTFCGFTISLLAKVEGKPLIFRPNDSLLSFGLQLMAQRSRILGILMVAYGALVEFVVSRLSDLILASSRKIMYLFQSYYGVRGKICVCHIGTEARKSGKNRVDVRKELGIPQGDLVVLFLGAGDWLPNQLAIEYIQKTLAPFLAAEKSEVLLMIVGRGTERFRNSITTNNLVIVGEVPDISPYLEAADLGIAPMPVMGGQSSKVIDYLCAGLPVVATNEVAGTVEPQVGLFVSDIEHFHIAVSRLLKEETNLNMAERITSESLKHYSWNAIGVQTAKRILALEV